MDLGTPHVVTAVEFCPRQGMASRMTLGLFEGANSPDFGDAVPLLMISGVPADGQMTRSSVACSVGFRYVRYVGPSDTKCNLAELAFFGYPSVGNSSGLHQLTNLPTVSIHTHEAQDVVSKEVYLKAIVHVISAGGTSWFTDSTYIRGRGNASWEFPKKPYRIKLYNKASLLGMPAKAKSWTLINNYGDKSLMRNLLAFDLSEKMEMPYTPAGKLVDLILNGEYKGTYQLCDQVEVASGRVEVEKMSNADQALPNLSGGYFIEMDAYAYTEPVWFQSKRNQIPVTIKYPDDEEIIPAQRNYIQSHFNEFESAVYTYNYADLTNGYRRYLDVETFIRHLLVGELAGNTDTYWSTYLFKKRNDDRFYVAPVWDFDLGYDNDYRTYPIDELSDFIFATKGSAAQGVADLVVNRLMKDQALFDRVKAVYRAYRNSGAISEESLLRVVDGYAEVLNQSQQLNFTRWNILGSFVHMNPVAYGNYTAEVDHIKTYIRNRIKWMDQRLELKTGVDALTFAQLKYTALDGVLRMNGLPPQVVIEVYDLSGVLRQKGVFAQQAVIPTGRGLFVVKLISSEGSVYALKVMVR